MSISYETFKKKVLDKWNHKCATCGSAKKLRIHHVKPLKKSKRHYTLEEISKCIVLCYNCHDAIHYHESCKKDLKFHKEMLFHLWNIIGKNTIKEQMNN